MTSKTFVTGTVIDSAWLNDVNDLTYYQPSDTGTVERPGRSKLNDTVSVKDFGAVGTAVPGNVTLDTAAFLAALATGKNVIVPQGTYYISSTLSVGAGQCFWGAGRGKTIINYTGTGTGIYCGAPGSIQLIYDIHLQDFTLSCTNITTRVDHGIMLENCVYFNLERLSVFGPGSPNSAVPAERVLTGNGIYITNCSIIGRISACSTRLWEKGYYLKTLAGSASFWTASIVIDGQGEMANCMFGLVIGDPTISHASGVGVSIRDMCFQGCYSGAMLINSGENTVVDACYFEGNANYDVTIGTTGAAQPICCKVINCIMTSEDIGVTPYGNFPYTSKIIVVDGSFATIRDNDISINTSIPLVEVKAACEYTSITGNRLNSIIAVGSRILNASSTTLMNDNFPNQAKVFVGTFNRTMNAATGNVSYTGVGFKPTLLRFTAAVNTVNQWSDGFSDGVTHRAMNDDGVGGVQSSAHAIKIIRPTAADIVTATVVSFDADGFTLNWASSGAPPANTLVVNYIASR
jgi:hypothetical protein